MKTIRCLISVLRRQGHYLLLTGLTACTPSLSVNNPEGRPLYDMPDDGLAEVARYAYSLQRHGLPLNGTATLIVTREYLNRQTYVKTQQPKQRMPVIKIVLMKTLPAMNWDNRENSAMFCRNDLRPVRLAITAEEWCGNNYLEWIARGDEVSLLGRPYVEEGGRLTTQIAVKAGYYLYEQLPVLVRALAQSDARLTLRMMAPQNAYLLPHAREVQVDLAREGAERIVSEAGEFSTIVVGVTPADSCEFFTEAERYWIDEQRHFIVRAERNEVVVDSDGKVSVDRAVYELQKYDRMHYSAKPAPPATASLADRQRATYSSWTRLNLSKDPARQRAQAALQKSPGDWPKGESVPAEYISTPKGSNRIVQKYDGAGGWWFNKTSGLFELNYPTNSARLFTFN